MTAGRIGMEKYKWWMMGAVGMENKNYQLEWTVWNGMDWLLLPKSTAYAYLGDEKKIHEQMKLFTKDATYKVFMNGNLVANTTGTDILEQEFNGHAAQVKTYFTMNGQHTVALAGTTATGVSYSQLKMVRKIDGRDILTDYSVRYNDVYTYQGNQWLISERIGHFIIIEARTLDV